MLIKLPEEMRPTSPDGVNLGAPGIGALASMSLMSAFVAIAAIIVVGFTSMFTHSDSLAMLGTIFFAGAAFFLGLALLLGIKRARKLTMRNANEVVRRGILHESWIENEFIPIIASHANITLTLGEAAQLIFGGEIDNDRCRIERWIEKDGIVVFTRNKLGRAESI